MDFIITDVNGYEKGFANHCGAEFNVGQDNDFEVKIRNSLYDEEIHQKNCRLYAPETEYGGLIRRIHPVTKDKIIKLGGRTWRGILSKRAINPDSNTHIYLDGEANTVIKEFISKLGLSELFSVSDEDSGIVFENYKVPLQGMFMEVLESALAKGNARLEIKYKSGESNAAGFVFLAAVPIQDHSEEIEISQDGNVKLDILDYKEGVNHLICFGQGEGADRQRVDLYVNQSGEIQKTQYYQGIDLIEEYYENTNTVDLIELEEFGRERLNELMDYKQLKISVSDMDLELGDIVGGRERVTNIKMKAPVVRKIVSITGRGRVKINYKLKGEE